MKRRSQVLAITVAGILSCGAAAALARRQAGLLPQTRALSCPSPALGGRLPAIAYLPRGYYRNATMRYRVVYFLHGLPANPDTYKSVGWAAAKLAGTGKRAIVVVPQGARSANSDREYLDWSPTENWPRAIARDLPQCVDAAFRTIADRSGRALIGFSAGGYGAFNIGLRHEATFGAVESWGGYFEATNPAGTRRLNLGSRRRNELARAPRGSGLKKAVTRRPTFVGFYVGAGDTRFRQDNVDFDRSLSAHGIKHLFRIYQGGHTTALFRAQAPPWLEYALSWLASLPG